MIKNFDNLKDILDEPVNIVATYKNGEADVHIDGNASVVLIVLDEIYNHIKKLLGDKYDLVKLQSKFYKLLSIDLED